MFDSGVIKIYKAVDTAVNGGKPSYTLELITEEFYEERTIGVTRFYAAMGANVQVDLVARIWENRDIMPEAIVADESGTQYRVSLVQHTTDEDGLRVTDLTMERLGANYDVE